jgi:hypothetical protein
MSRRERTVVAVAIAGVFSACIAGTDPDAVRVLEKTARQNALEAQTRMTATGLKPGRIAPNNERSATTLQVEATGAEPSGWMSYLSDAKAGQNSLQASADAYIVGGYPPAAITIGVSGEFENKNGSTPFNTTVRGTGAARFYKAWASSCWEHIKSSSRIDGHFSASYSGKSWGPVDYGASKACSNEDTCDFGMTRKSGRANLNSGVCDEDTPIYGTAGGDTPVDNTPGTLHCWWYRDMLILFDPITGKVTDIFWIGEWKHDCEYALLSSGPSRADEVPVVLRARGPLGTTERPTMLIAEAGDTVSIAIDTTRATGADLDAALTRAATMWKLRGAARDGGIIATTLAPNSAAVRDDSESRGAQLLRKVKREASHHMQHRGNARELTTTVERRP